VTKERFGGPACLAGALNAGEPIEEPQTDRAGDVENHLADLDFDLTVRSGCGCRCHRVSFSLEDMGKIREITSGSFLTPTYVCVIQNLSLSVETLEKHE
jgi:hypothetical protein